MEDLINTYGTELESIKVHAIAIGFDFNYGDFDFLMRSWIESGRKFCEAAADNRIEVRNRVKRSLNA